MRRDANTCRTALAALALAALLAAPAAASGTAIVTSGDDDGAGSLRAALASGANDIRVRAPGDIVIDSPLTYTGRAPLRITGAGQSLRASGDFNLLQVIDGADLAIENLAFIGPGGFSIHRRSARGQRAGKGIALYVGGDRRGTVRLELTDVRVGGVAGHGIHVSDCDLVDDCGGGGSGEGGGSAAGIHVSLRNVAVEGVGHGRFDADGLRVDERGDGGVTLVATGSSFTGAGADGVELDEGGRGDVLLLFADSRADHNGAYCAPAVLQPRLEAFLDGAAARRSFREAERARESDVPGEVTGSPDDRCFEREVERYESGLVAFYEIKIDFDDGLDIDEAGDGDLRALLVDAQVARNLDEGVDFDEKGRGGIELGVTRSQVEGNSGDGLKLTEKQGGGVSAALHRLVAAGNGGEGVQLKESGKGSVNVLLSASRTAGNGADGRAGVEVLQQGAGGGALAVHATEAGDIRARGVSVHGD